MRPLTLIETLELYDVPQIMVAADAVGTQYLCTLFSNDEEGYHYLGVQISDPRLIAFLGGQLDLREAYVHPEAEGAVWLVNVKEGKIVAEHQIQPNETEESMLPEAGYYFDASNLADGAIPTVDTYQLEVPAHDRVTFSTLISRMGWKALSIKKVLGKVAAL